MEKKDISQNEILFYQDDDGDVKIEVLYSDEDVWLTQARMAKLFDVARPDITKHINNIYKQKELEEKGTCSILEHMGKTGQKYKTKYYNLDMIISVGFRVNSKKAIKFRTWANKIIKDYIIQGFALNDERFMKGKKGDQEYFKRLLERIKLIRTSERMFYQKITDIFAECSIDYDKNSEITHNFYKNIQNKFHYAITGNTAAEIVYDRVDSKKENMGLTSWAESPDGVILKSDVIIAKNYLDEKELKKLNNLVNLFLDVAESKAEEMIPMKMVDWDKQVITSLKLLDKNILTSKGNISHKQAKEKAEGEYDKYRVIQDKKYFSDFDKMVKKIKNDKK